MFGKPSILEVWCCREILLCICFQYTVCIFSEIETTPSELSCENVTPLSNYKATMFDWILLISIDALNPEPLCTILSSMLNRIISCRGTWGFVGLAYCGSSTRSRRQENNHSKDNPACDWRQAQQNWHIRKCMSFLCFIFHTYFICKNITSHSWFQTALWWHLF